jgi:hypothetical protein
MTSSAPFFMHSTTAAMSGERSMTMTGRSLYWRRMLSSEPADPVVLAMSIRTTCGTRSESSLSRARPSLQGRVTTCRPPSSAGTWLGRSSLPTA